MPGSPMAASRALRRVLGGLQPEAFSGDDCAAMAEDLARTEKSCAAARAALGARAAELGAHHRRGYATAVEWLARATGSSAGQARAALDIPGAMEDCPATKQAALGGELSLAQAQEIAKTEAACPGTEAELLSLARTSSLGVLRDTARARRLDATDPDELHAAQQGAREVRGARDDLGMVRLVVGLPPLVGIPILNRLEAETDRIHTAARRAGSTESRAAHAADALVRMLTGKGRPTAGRADLVMVWQRPGDGGEGTAHLVGGGPVPVAQARALAEVAFVKALVHDGVRIETVKHYGRYRPAELRTALELGGPADFDGVVCVDCGTRYRIQYDHVDPVANGGPTTRANLSGRCWDCHELKTERDRQAGLLGNGKGNANRGTREPP